MFLFGNLTGDSDKLRRSVLLNFDLIGTINTVLRTHTELPKIYARNSIWVASNLAKESKNFNLDQCKGLTLIFYEFIEFFYQKDTNDDDCLLDIVKGLTSMSGTSDVKMLDWVSGINCP